MLVERLASMAGQQRRRHGCHAPFKLEQVAAVVLWLLLVGACYALILPMAQLRSRADLAAAAAVYTALVVAVAVLHVTTSLMDARDTSGDDEMPDAPEPGTWFCQACKKYMRPGTKHCGPCAKCVAGFDHHCVWLNTCVGAANYRAFFALLNAVVGLLAAEAAIGAALLSRSFLQPAAFRAALAAAYAGAVHPWAYRAALCGAVAAALGLLGALGGLWATHWVLLCKGATTWDMIRAHLEPRRAGGRAAGAAGGGGEGVAALRESGSGRQWVATDATMCGACCNGARVANADAAHAVALAVGGGQQRSPQQCVHRQEHAGRGKRVSISPMSALSIRPKPGGGAHGPWHGCHRGAVAAEERSRSSGFDAAAPAMAATSPSPLPGTASPRGAGVPSSPRAIGVRFE
ncbi:MAG: DHHC palmitoyltransferase-domain-containing protein [Monoraphidium minutum]|nr:MAG: DHHC palmitoyltransferase-domain-containing protein [Monoraphidium minutum]